MTTFAHAMANDFFHFKQFSVYQDRCAMKVGTDGTLLGAWAEGGDRILDIGTGTGLIALMMAQRFPNAKITAIDCDTQACLQASDNVAASPFASQINVINTSLQQFVPSSRQRLSNSPAPSCQLLSSSARYGSVTTFQAIVCNPPFFENALQSPNGPRTTARHTVSLSYYELFQGVDKLLDAEGVFSAIIPFDCRQRFEEEAVLAGLFPSRVCGVSTTPAKAPRRFLLAFRRTPAPHIESLHLVIGDAQYQTLLHDFLIHL